jgi:hypothetical protein
MKILDEFLQMVIFCFFFDCVQLELRTSPTSILLRNCLQTKDSIQFRAEERNDFVVTIISDFLFFFLGSCYLRANALNEER